MRSSIFILLLAAALLLVPLAAPAQVHPNLEKGFAPDKMYEFHDVDYVNLFNGNLSLTIPIGGATPVSDHLALSMTLVYNSKIWDTATRPNLNAQVPEPQTLKSPSGRSNAGLGWMLTFGRLFDGGGTTNDGDIVPDNATHYESPDGGDGIFWDTLHSGSDETAEATRLFTRDGRYIRLTAPAGLNTRSIETPDGLVRDFSTY